MATLNHEIVYKLLVFDRNTWNRTSMCRLFVLKKNLWYHIILFKQHWKITKLNNYLDLNMKIQNITLDGLKYR